MAVMPWLALSAAASVALCYGKAVLVEPMQPVLKAPMTQRLHHEVLSSFA